MGAMARFIGTAMGFGSTGRDLGPEIGLSGFSTASASICGKRAPGSRFVHPGMRKDQAAVRAWPGLER